MQNLLCFYILKTIIIHNARRLGKAVSVVSLYNDLSGAGAFLEPPENQKPIYHILFIHILILKFYSRSVTSPPVSLVGNLTVVRVHREADIRRGKDIV